MRQPDLDSGADATVHLAAPLDPAGTDLLLGRTLSAALPELSTDPGQTFSASRRAWLVDPARFEASATHDFPLLHLVDSTPVGVSESQAVVLRQLKMQWRDFALCYVRAQSADPSLRGTVTLRLSWGRSGIVTRVEALPSTSSMNDVAHCVEMTAKGMVVPAPPPRLHRSVSVELRYESP